MTALLSASVVTWVYVAVFGLSTILVAGILTRQGRLPTPFGSFEAFSGPFSARLSHRSFVVLLMAFLFVTLIAAWAAWLVWNGSKPGAVLLLGMVPLEAVFWFGFALPIPPLLGAARVVLLIVGWKSL